MYKRHYSPKPTFIKEKKGKRHLRKGLKYKKGRSEWTSFIKAGLVYDKNNNRLILVN